MSPVGSRPRMEVYTQPYPIDERVILSVQPGVTKLGSLMLVRLDGLLGGRGPSRGF
jgi:lipopolysaccharide/colanic/teichoic acid biosynthesis glycosyltransferase